MAYAGKMVSSQPPATFGSSTQGAAAFVPAQGASGLLFFVTSAVIFTHFARPFDSVLAGYKLPAIICGVGILVALLTGGLIELRSRIGISFLVMVGWMCVSAPFSYWKGGTFFNVLSYAQFYLPLMLLVAVTSKTPRDIVKICGMLAFSCAFNLTAHASEAGGRYSLNATFGNPDDVALLAGFTMPFLVLVCSRIRNPVIRYGLLIGGCGYLLLLIGRTATRAAIPALIAMLAVYFFRSRGVQRVAILIFAGVGVMVVALTLPATTLERLSTVLEAFSPGKGYSGMSEAQASALERHEVMRDAIKVTLSHPIVGVGAGMFTQYRWDKMKGADGLSKPYLPTHNTYLEISSECGIPAVIFYLMFLGAIYGSIRTMRKLTAARPPELDLLYSIALCTEAALVYFVVCAAFMTCDKHPHQFVLAGIAIALERMARSPLAGLSVTPPKPLPMAAVPFVGKRRPYPVVAR